MYNPKLPLVDLHRHLDGNIQPHTILALAQKYQLPLAELTLDQIAEQAQIQDRTSDLLAFLKKLDLGVSVLVNSDACYQVAYENMRDAKRNGLDYVELRFSPMYMGHVHNLNRVELIAAVIDGVQAGQRDFGVRANLIGILDRSNGAVTCIEELQYLLKFKDQICALDLAGNERDFPAELFVQHFRIGRDAGLHITVHAGEAAGAESIWQAINLLGAERIGHGVNAIHDKNLMEYMAKHKIAVESCPTSNYQTGTVINTSEHPLKQFLQQDMLVTLNTDDPGVSNIVLADEYRVAKEQIGLSQSELDKIQKNGLKAAFLTDSELKKLV